MCYYISMKNKFDIISIGGLTQDYICNTYGAIEIKKNNNEKYIAFDFGSKHYIDLQSKSFGGGALNSAASFSRLGLRIAVASIIGNDIIGQEVKYYLKNKKINETFLQTAKQKATAFSFIMNSTIIRDHLLFVYPGATERLRLIKSLSMNNHQTKYYFVTALVGPYADYNLHYLWSLAQTKKIKVFWNPGLQQIEQIKIWQKYFNTVEYFSVNQEECINILQQFKVRSGSGIKSMMAELLKLGLSKVIVTCGEEGAYYYDGYEFYHQPVISTKVKNTTGAGDAFNSGFLSGLFIYSGFVKKALLLGARNAAAILQTYGAHEGGLSKRDL